jgi:hypothetical protein
VSPQQSDRAYERQLRAGWPAVRYWHPDALDHDFAGVPLIEGLRWLGEVAATEPAELLRTAGVLVQTDRVADAEYVLARAARLGAKEIALRPLRKRLEPRVQRLVKQWLARIAADRDPFGADWHDLRAGLEPLPAFAPVFERFAEAAARHAERAQELAAAAGEAERRGDGGEAARLHREIVERCSAAFEAAAASRRWLLRRGG